MRIWIIFYLLITSSLAHGFQPTAEISRADDPLFHYQWGLYNNGQSISHDIDDIHQQEIHGRTGYDIQWEEIHNNLASLEKKIVVVAIVDSGITTDHPDIKDMLFKNDIECIDGRPPFKTEEDRDHNDYSGDCLGWNFAAKSELQKRQVEDDIGHGTHVAGIVAAATNNGVGISGVSKNIRILPIKVYNKKEDPGAPVKNAIPSRVVNAIRYAITRKVDVINLSMGWPLVADTPELRSIFKEALEKNITIVAGAGNDSISENIFPCSYEGVICVGSIDMDGSISSFSNFGGAVDFLAPGDNILSLWPTTETSLYFGSKGYEIKSGTSQSAPFVSGLAAILKSIYPYIKNSEIYARLMATSKGVQLGNKNFLGGLVQLKDSINVKPQAIVRPIFKDFDQVVVRSDRSFSFRLPIKNYWMPTKNIKIEIKSDEAGLRLVNPRLSISHLSTNEKSELQIHGVVESLEIESKIKLSVVIIVDGIKKSYQTVLSLSRDVIGDPHTKKYEIFLDQASNTTPLSSIPYYPKTFYEPEFYKWKKVENGLVINIFKFHGQTLVEEKNITLLGEKLLMPDLSILKVDLNYDGKPDYLIRSIAQKQDDQEIHWYLFDSNFNPLFGKYSMWTLDFDSVLLDPKSMSFVRYESSDFGTIAIPAFWATGRIPKIDADPNPLNFEENLSMRRFYIFEPKIEGHDVRIKTRLPLNYQRLDKLTRELSLSYREPLNLLASFPQSSQKFGYGELQLLASVGRNLKKKYMTLNIDAKFLNGFFNSRQFLNLDGNNIDGHRIVPSTDISREDLDTQSATSLFAVFRNNIGRTIQLSGDGLNIFKEFEVSTQSPSDSLVTLLASYYDQKGVYSFYESASDLIYRAVSDQKDLMTTRSIQRFSYLPGHLFTEKHFPLMRRTMGKWIPALYVDASTMSERSAYVWSAQDDKLVSPVRLKYEIPSNCEALNPMADKSSKTYYFVLYCQDLKSKKSYLYTLAIE